jgi:hypothetical protein
MAVGLAVLVVESCGESIEARTGDRSVGKWHRQLVSLTAVAEIGGSKQHAPRRRNRRRREPFGCRGFHLSQCCGGHGRVERTQIGVEGARIVALEVGGDEPKRGKGARRRRYNDLGDLQFGGECCGVYGTSAAKGNQREFARIVTALDRDDAKCLGHIAVDDLDDRGGGFGDPQPERIGHAFADRRLRCRKIDRERAAQQGFAIEVAEHYVSVADRRVVPTESVSHRTRGGAGAARPDFQRTAGIDPRDAAAAGADLGEVDDRHSHRMAGPLHPALGMPLAADFVFGGDDDLAVGDQARFCRRPAHVERDKVGKGELPAGECGGDHPGCRSGLDCYRRHP